MKKNDKLTLIISGSIFAFFVIITLVMIAIDRTEELETLATGFMSVMAALGGFFMVQRQMMQVRQIEDERNEKRYMATKAKLPLLLSAILKLPLNNLRTLELAYNYMTNNHYRWDGNFPDYLSVHKIDSDLIKEFSDTVECIPHLNVSRRIGYVLRVIQAHESRLDTLIFPKQYSSLSAHMYELKKRSLDTVILYNYIASLFSYARSEVSFHENYDLDRVDFKFIDERWLSMFGNSENLEGAIYDMMDDEFKNSTSVSVAGFSINE